MFLSNNVKTRIIESLNYILDIEKINSEDSSSLIFVPLKNIFDIVQEFRFFTEIKKRPIDSLPMISLHNLDKNESLFYLIDDILKDNNLLDMNTVNINKSYIAMLDYFSIWYLKKHLDTTENKFGIVERIKLYNHYASFNLFDEETFKTVYLNKVYKPDVLQKVYLLEDFSLTLYQRIKKIHKENSTELNKNIFEKIINGLITGDIDYNKFKNSEWGVALNLQVVSENNFIYEHKEIFQNKFFNLGINTNHIQQIISKCPQVLLTKDNNTYVDLIFQRLFSVNKHDISFQRNFSPEKAIFFINKIFYKKEDLIQILDRLTEALNTKNIYFDNDKEKSINKLHMIIQSIEQNILNDEFKNNSVNKLKKRL